MTNDNTTYERLANWIYCILHNDSINFFTHDKRFISLFEKELFFLYCLEKKHSKNIDLGNKFLVKSLIQDYNQKIGKNFVLPLGTRVDLNNLDDEINYLFIYCRNVFKVDLNELAKNSNLSKQKTIEIDQANNLLENNNQQTFNFGNNTNMKILEQIKLGKIFIYTSRPKIIPILKKIFSLFLLINIFLIIFMIIISIRINGLYLGSDSTINTQWNIINYFFLLFINVTFFLKFIPEVVNNQNDNTKYYFQWRSALLIFAINFFSFIYVDFNQFKEIENYDKSQLEDRFLYLSLVSYWYVWFMIIIVLIGIFLVIMLAIHYNPKKDIAMIRKLIEQQISEIDKNKEDAN